MRIGIEAQRLFRKKKHGMDVVAMELINHLQEIDTENEYVIFTRDESDASISTAPNFRINSMPALNYGTWEQSALPAAAKKEKIDMLHCTGNTGPVFSSIPMVLTLHDIIFLETLNFTGTAYQNVGNLYRRFVAPRIVKKSKIVFTVSEFERDNILEKIKIDPEKIQVLYNGVSAKFHNSFSKETIADFRKKYSLPDRFMLFLGNTDKKKNTANVIRAAAEVFANQKDPMPLVILDYKKELVQKQLEELRQPDLIKHFIFPGYIPHAEMPLIYNAATLYLYPSIRESFGLPILEAMGCGVPVITSNTSSMPEIAGDAACIVDPYDFKSIAEAIHKLQNDEELRESYRAKGLERVKLFTWKRSAEQLLRVYEEQHRLCR